MESGSQAMHSCETIFMRLTGMCYRAVAGRIALTTLGLNTVTVKTAHSTRNPARMNNASAGSPNLSFITPIHFGP